MISKLWNLEDIDKIVENWSSINKINCLEIITKSKSHIKVPYVIGV